MRRFLLTLKTAAVVLAALACAALLVAAERSPVFAAGEGYELYYGASSASPMERTGAPFLKKLTGTVAGESVRYRGDRYEEIKAAFGAELCFTEEAGGTVNYYLYSPRLGGGVLLKGQRVNLHIATGNGQTAAGTPLIFGGF